MPNTEIFRRIGAALGLDHPRLRDSDEDLVRQLLAGTPVTFEELRERTYARTTGVAVGSAPFATGGFPTADGRARLLDPTLERRGIDPLVGYTPPVEAADLSLAQRFPLVLLAAVAVDDATRPGLAFTYKAYWPRLSPGRTNVNAVTAVRDTDLGGGPTFHDTRVALERVPAGLLEVGDHLTGVTG